VIFPKEESVQRNDRDCLVFNTDIPCRVKNTPIVSLNPFSSLSSFQGTNCACRSVDEHPWGGATNYYATQKAKKVKTPRFSRRAWPSLFVPLRFEHVYNTQDLGAVKSPSTATISVATILRSLHLPGRGRRCP
jgi:hypothetical protein